MASIPPSTPCARVGVGRSPSSARWIGYGGVPNAYAYGPSKAAVISLAVGLEFLAEPSGVSVQVINPGYGPHGADSRQPLSDAVPDGARRSVPAHRRGAGARRLRRSLSPPARLDRAGDQPAARGPLYFALLRSLGGPRGKGEGFRGAAPAAQQSRRPPRDPGWDRPEKGRGDPGERLGAARRRVRRDERTVGARRLRRGDVSRAASHSSRPPACRCARLPARCLRRARGETGVTLVAHVKAVGRKRGAQGRPITPPRPHHCEA